MSIVGFPVVPNNEYLNTCTCVGPVRVFYFPALQEGQWGFALVCPISAWGLHKPARSQTCIASPHMRHEGLVHNWAIWALLPTPKSDLMRSDDSLTVCGSCSCWRHAGNFWSAHEFGGFFTSAASAVLLQNKIFTIANISWGDTWNLLFSLQNLPLHREEIVLPRSTIC